MRRGPGLLKADGNGWDFGQDSAALQKTVTQAGYTVFAMRRHFGCEALSLSQKQAAFPQTKGQTPAPDAFRPYQSHAYGRNQIRLAVMCFWSKSFALGPSQKILVQISRTYAQKKYFVRLSGCTKHREGGKDRIEKTGRDLESFRKCKFGIAERNMKTAK